jgi:N-acetylmuramoyl-L-alanine amidase
LLARCSDARRPLGPILVVDPSHGNNDPGLKELGERVKVVYLNAETWL